MSETLQATVEIDGDSPPADSDVRPAGDKYISELEDFSMEELRDFAEEVDAVLGPIMTSHGDEIVKCERLGGAEMTLSQAVLSIWPRSEKGAMIKEGLPSVMAEIDRMRSTTLPEDEESEEEKKGEEEEKEPEEDEVTEKESSTQIDNKDAIQTDKASSIEVDEAKQPKKEIDVVRLSKQPSSKVQESYEFEEANTDMSGIGAGIRSSSRPLAARNEQRRAKHELNTSKSNLSERSTKRNGNGSNSADYKTVSSASIESLFENGGVIEPAGDSKHSIVSPEIPKVEPSGDYFAENEQPADSDLRFEQQELVPHSLFLEEEMDSDTDPALLLNSDLKDTAVFEDATELSDEIKSIAAEGLVEPEQKYEPGADIIIDLTEEDLFDHFERADLDADSISVDLGRIGRSDPESPVLLGLAVDEAEDSLAGLAEVIESTDVETTQELNETLDKIIEVQVNLEAENEGNSNEVEAQEELKKLFMDLLDKMGIEYTPELVESFARLSLEGRFVEEIKKIEKEEVDDKPQDSGTNEIIKKLVVVLKTIKKAMSQAASIGRSVLRVYGFRSNLSPSFS